MIGSAPTAPPMTGARRGGWNGPARTSCRRCWPPARRWSSPPTVQADALEDLGDGPSGRHSEHVSGVLARHARSPAYIKHSGA